MSKRKSLARLAVERSQSSQDITEENVRRSSSNARPLGHHAGVDVAANDCLQHQSLPPDPASNGAPQPPAVGRHRPGRRSAEQSKNPSQPDRTVTHNNRHSYPAAAGTVGQTSRQVWQSPGILSRQPPGSAPQKPPRTSLQHPVRSSPQRSEEPPRTSLQQPVRSSPQRPGDSSSARGRPGAVPGRVLLSDGTRSGAGGTSCSPAGPMSASRPTLSLSPPVNSADPLATENGLPFGSPSTSSGSSAGGSSGESALLTAGAMHHAHSTTDLQERTRNQTADVSLGNAPITARHRTR